MSTIRILHVISSLSLSNGIMGVIMNYYRFLNLEKIKFDFLYFEESEKTYKGEINALGGKVFKVDAPGLKNIFSYSNYLTMILQKFKFNYDIVHCHELVLLSIVSPALRRNGAKHIIAHSHSVVYSYHKLKSIRNRLLSIPMKKLSDSYCACSEVSGKFWFGNDWVRKGKVNIINNAIDCEKFLFDESIRNQVRTSLCLKKNYIIGHVGRFSKEKNHYFLIDIFIEVYKIHPNTRLLLIGDGPMFSEVKQKVVNLKIESKVIFLGQRNDVNRLYQAMDVFVFPSEYLSCNSRKIRSCGIIALISSRIYLSIRLHPFQTFYNPTRSKFTILFNS